MNPCELSRIVALALTAMAALAMWPAAHASDDLLNAAYYGDLPKIQILLARGADIDFSDGTGHTALTYAAQQGQEGAVKELLRRGAAVNVLRVDGQAPLHFAAASGELPIVDALVAAHADFDLQSVAGFTPMTASPQP